MRPRVFVPTEPKAFINLGTLAEFGDVEMILPPDVPHVSAFHTNEFAALILERLKARNFDPLVDSIALTGTLVPTSLALAAIVNRYKRVTVCLFVSQDSTYVQRTLNADVWMKGLNDG